MDLENLLLLAHLGNSKKTKTKIELLGSFKVLKIEIMCSCHGNFTGLIVFWCLTMDKCVHTWCLSKYSFSFFVRQPFRFQSVC